MNIRDRIVELRRVNASELLPNPKNWRTHPKQQKAALNGVLKEIGYADALLARQMPDGKLMLVDGHLRKETTPDHVVPVLVLDITEAESDKLLATLDPLAAMAGKDAPQLLALLDSVATDDAALRKMLADMAGKQMPAEKGNAGGDAPADYCVLVTFETEPEQMEFINAMLTEGRNVRALV